MGRRDQTSQYQIEITHIKTDRRNWRSVLLWNDDMPRLLILLTLPPDVIEQYRARLSRLFPELSIDIASRKDELAPLRSADILMTFGQVMKNLDVDIENAPNLKWVQAMGTGLDGITDQPALKPDTIVTSLHGVHGAPVSEAALAGMLALSRDLARSVRLQDKRNWQRWPARLLHGKTVGIVGIGVIAEALAPKCKAMGMTVLGFTSTKREVAGFDRVHGMDELVGVLPQVDYLVLLTPYSPATHRMINAKVFAAMKPDSYLINVARGGIVDEDALVDALNAGRLAGAALDVFEREPLPPEHPLWGFENVIITTHQGGFCDTYIDFVMPTLERNMRCFLAGDLQGMVNVVRHGAIAS
jgi:D-2-hydroxyacid dehydrogenase (NADP+)